MIRNHVNVSGITSARRHGGVRGGSAPPAARGLSQGGPGGGTPPGRKSDEMSKLAQMSSYSLRSRIFGMYAPRIVECDGYDIYVWWEGGGITMKSPLPHGYYRSKNVAITVLPQCYHGEPRRPF